MIAVVLLVIFALIGTAIGILYIVRTTPTIICKPKETDYIAMIMAGTSTEINKHDINYNKILSTYSLDVPVKENRVMFSIGNTLDLSDVNVLTYFDTDKIFYSPAIFSKEWTTHMINSGIYFPKLTGDLFVSCGYYKKHLPNSSIDIICFNSSDKIEDQLTQLKYDLTECVKNKKNVYILIRDSTKIWGKIEDKYKSVISGVLTTSDQNKVVSLGNWKTLKGPSHIWTIPQIYSKNKISYIKVGIPLLNTMSLAQTDVNH